MNFSMTEHEKSDLLIQVTAQMHGQVELYINTYTLKIIFISLYYTFIMHISVMAMVYTIFLTSVKKCKIQVIFQIKN